MTRSSDDTTWPAATPTWVHWIQARKAFEPGSGAYPGRVVYAGDGTVLIERIPEHTTTELVIARPDRLGDILARTDLTRLRGASLVLVSEEYRVLAVATGPDEAPGQIRCSSGISRLEGQEAVEIPAAGGDQPSWQLLGARLAPTDTSEQPD